MEIFVFILNSVLLGVGLAMDAFSVSLANGLNNPKMKKTVIMYMAGAFALFQFAMPLIGWVCVHTIATTFTTFQTFIPYIALALLAFIGGKMLKEGIHQVRCDKDHASEEAIKEVTFGALMVQGVATSIDALSVGFTISDYRLLKALGACLIIGAVTFVICLAGIFIGKKFGTKLSGWASVLGGVILIGIGLEIFISNVFF